MDRNSPPLSRPTQPPQAAAGPREDSFRKTRIKTTGPKSSSNLVATKSAKASPRLVVQADNPANDDEEQFEDPEDHFHTGADVQAAEKLFVRLQNARDLNGLLITLTEGSVHSSVKTSKTKTNFLCLDFGSKTLKRSILGFRLEGLAGHPVRFQAALGYTKPKGTKRGGSSLYIGIVDAFRHSDNESEKWKVFGVLELIDGQVAALKGNDKGSKKSEKEAKKPEKKERPEAEQDDGFAVPQGRKKGRTETPDPGESEKIEGEERSSSQISPVVVNLMIWENPEQITAAGQVLLDRYSKWARDKIEKKAEEEKWEETYRTQIEKDVRAEAKQEEKDRLKAWWDENEAKARKELAEWKKIQEADWTAWKTAKEREIGRQEIKKELEKQRIVAGKAKASQTPGLAEVDVTRPISEYELQKLDALFREKGC